MHWEHTICSKDWEMFLERQKFGECILTPCDHMSQYNQVFNTAWALKVLRNLRLSCHFRVRKWERKTRLALMVQVLIRIWGGGRPMRLQQQCQRLNTQFSSYDHALAFTFLSSKMKRLRQMIAKVISSLKFFMFFQEILGMKQELRMPCLVLQI